MPITFEQPQPVSPQISMGYGAAEQWSKDFPTLARQQEAIASANSHYQSLAAAQQSHQAELASRASIANAGMMQDWGQQQYGADAAIARNDFETQGQLNARMAEQQQHAQLQSWLMGQDMTMQEQMRLQNMQQGIAAIDTAEQNGTLSQAEAQQWRLDIAMPMQQLKQKQIATQTRAEQEQAKKIALDNQQTQDLLKRNRDMRAKTANDGTATIFNPAIREQVIAEAIEAGLGDHPGFDQIVNEETSRRPNGAQHVFEYEPGKFKPVEWGDTKAAEAEMKHYETSHAVWLNHHKAYQDSLNKEIAQATKENQDAMKRSPEATRQATDEELVAAAKRRITIPEPGPEPQIPTPRGHIQTQSRATAKPAEQPAEATSPAQARKAVNEAKPFTKWEDATASQKSLVQDFGVLIRGIQVSGLPVQQKAEATQAMGHIETLLKRYGSIARMQEVAADKKSPEAELAGKDVKLWGEAINMITVLSRRAQQSPVPQQVGRGIMPPNRPPQPPPETPTVGDRLRGFGRLVSG